MTTKTLGDYPFCGIPGHIQVGQTIELGTHYGDRRWVAWTTHITANVPIPQVMMPLYFWLGADAERWRVV